MSRNGAGKARGSGRATLEEVAGLAGVSIMTASRALSQPRLVSDATRAKVEQAVAELGYVPNRAARALASSQSRVIVALVPSLSNVVFTAVLDGIQDAIAEGQYQLLIGNTHYSDAEEEKLLRTYLQSNPDGILLSSLAHSPEVTRMLDGSRIPTVSMMDLADDTARLTVGFSQLDAGSAMTRHLLARGYRRIAFIGAQLDERTLRRADGYRQAMRAAGLYDPALEIMVPDPSTIALGAELMQRALDTLPGVDAVFCCNDDLAHGAIYYCQRHDVKVPGDVAIAGFNDLPASAWMVPSLTTIDTPRYRIGYEAATLLVDLLAGREPRATRVDLGFTLREREST
ncbi:LacI family DNA-binding transcriptional regulator [Massilia sp. YIM B02763]|uniref:LacI family DNA-binding transcriptional regulator n=1 Tax=Massilia sp. YIM B02763 TaxID=3050130 RepID=UPI0025B66063|nr:LacI family DNA-binding transcriptional regulator [Massilia sp. YIM B02763]MDN4051493.1 LacI family DNA-binding transcriptional regulator [Massilia sp. YIM B02763]